MFIPWHVSYKRSTILVTKVGRNWHAFITNEQTIYVFDIIFPSLEMQADYLPQLLYYGCIERPQKYQLPRFVIQERIILTYKRKMFDHVKDLYFN
jgi:hypothetical protein